MKKSMTKIMKGAIAITMSLGMGVGAGISRNKNTSVLEAAAGGTPSGTWSPIASASDIIPDTDYLLAYTYSGNPYYSKSSSLSSNALQTDSALSSAKMVRFVPVTGGWNIQIAASTFIGYYGDSTKLSSNTTGGTSATYVWAPNTHANGDIYFTTNNGGRFLGAASAAANSNIKAYSTSGSGLTTYPRVTAYKKVLSSISVQTAPTKTSYNVGELFDPTGLVITRTYSDSTTDTFAYANHTSQFTFTPSLSSALAVENTSISITFEGKTTNQPISVAEVLTPYATPAKNSTSGYTGQNETIAFSYGNTSSLNVVSSDEDVATVDLVSASEGSGSVQISFVGEGSADILFKDGSTVVGSINVSVTQVTLSLNKSSTSINRGDSETLIASHNASAVGGINWSSNNAKVMVDGGVVSVAYDSVVGSTATITATSSVDDSVSATCVVTIAKDSRWNTDFSNTMVASIELLPSGDTAEKYYVTCKISSITSTTYGNGTAVDENGTTFEIYGMYNLNGQMRYDAMYETQKPVVGDIVVLYGKFANHDSVPQIKNAWVMQRNSIVFEAQALAGVALNRSMLVLAKASTFTLTASPTPADAVLVAVTWSSSNTGVATVNGSGKVTAVSFGSTTITATAGGFTTTCLVKVTPSTSSLDLSTDTTTSASTEELTWTVSNMFDMQVEKSSSSTNANSYYPGTSGQTYSETRFYKNSVLTMTPNSNIVAVQARFFATSSSYASVLASSAFTNATAYAAGSSVFVTFTDGTQPFEVVVGGACGFTSVELYYEAAQTTIENSYSTRATLSYGYTKLGENSFTFDDVAIRFGGLISVDLWNRLNTESTITGYGVMLSTTAHVTANGGQLKNLSINGSTVVGFEKRVPEDKEHPVLANAAQKGNLVGDYYIWNLYNNVPESFFTTSLTAVAYIKTSSGNVYFEQVTVSVQSIANSMVVGGADTLEGSLNYLAELA